MTPEQQFEAWRAELVPELKSVNTELEEARHTQIMADIAHVEARNAWHDLNEFAAAAHRSPSEGTAGPLRSRILNSRETLTAAESARGIARTAVESLEYRQSELILSISQIDHALTRAKEVVQLPRAAEPTRPKPRPVEYDNIQMPREAV